MNPEEALLAYLYPKLVEAIQTWKGFDDIYGIWIGIVLYEDDPARPSFNVIGCLRKCLVTEERANYYGVGYWAPVLMNPHLSFKPGLCDDPWPDDDEDPADYDPQSLYAGDPEGRRLRDTFFQWKQEQPATLPFTNDDERSEARFEWFLEICGQLIRKLHEAGVLIEAFGQPIPVGFGIGDGGTATLVTVRDNNPVGLADGMLAWMRGEV